MVLNIKELYKQREATQREIDLYHYQYKKQQEIAFEYLSGKHLQDLPDEVAVKIPLLYPDFDSLIGQTIEKGEYKFTYDGAVYKTRQSNFTFQKHFPPGKGTESLYKHIDVVHSGTPSDPIPFNGNMDLEKDKYYVEDVVVYICIRNTENPVYNKLSELVGIYVETI